MLSWFSSTACTFGENSIIGGVGDCRGGERTELELAGERTELTLELAKGQRVYKIFDT